VESCRGGATLSDVEPVELVSSGLRLRPWRIGDAPAVLPALRDPAIARCNPPDHPDPDLAVARTWVTNRGDWTGPEHASFAVVDAVDDTLLGSVSLFLNRARMRTALAAVLALAAAPHGFTVTGFAEQVRVMTGQSRSGYSTRHASYDLHKIRGKHLVDKPGRTRRYHVPPDAARTIAALLTLRDQVIAPIVAGVRSPRMGRKPMTWTPVDRDYETLRIDLQTLFKHLGITTTPAAAA